MLDKDTFRRHANGTITGTIVWRIEDVSFPDDAWNDFVIVVLGWWLRAVNRLLRGISTSETLDLMDGPYSLICESSGHLVDCRFVERRTNQMQIATWSGETRELAKQILIAGRHAFRICQENGWMNSDIRLLESMVNTLRRVVY